MYLLEETEEAQEMREKVQRLLFTFYEPNIRLALQIISSGGFYKHLSCFDQQSVCFIVNSCSGCFLQVNRKGRYKVVSYFFEKHVTRNLKTGLFKLIVGSVTVVCYIPNPCHLKYFALFFLDCENVSRMKICTQSHTHKAILDITKFVLKNHNVTIKECSLCKEITIERI